MYTLSAVSQPDQTIQIQPIYGKKTELGGILESTMKRNLIVLGLLALSSFSFAEGNDAYASISDWFGVDPNAGQNSFLTLIIPGGGKYEGMATAHTAVALDGSYLEANPAAGSFLPSTALSFSHVDWIADSALETLSYAFRPESMEDMGLGFGLKYLHVPFTGYNDWGSQYQTSNGTAVGWYSELIATTAVSYNFLRSFYFGGVSVGGSLKVGYRGISASLASGQNAISLMGDLGAMTRFNFLKPYASREMNFGVGVMLKNIGGEFISDPDPLPTYFSTGFSYKPIRPITVAMDFNVPFNLDGRPSEKLSVAAGINVETAEFLSIHGGFLVKTGKPRLTMGADVRLNKMTLVANYTFDLATRFEMFDRISVAVKVDLDTVRQLIVKDDVQSLYLTGLSHFAEGELTDAIIAWENCLSLDPSFTPAREMLATARQSLELQTQLRKTLNPN